MNRLAALLALGLSLFCAGTSFGQTWTWQNPYPTGEALSDIAFTSPTEGWIVGCGGTILHTTDGGTSWETQFSGCGAPLEKLAVIGSDSVWAVGDGGLILRTTNRGASWNVDNGPLGGLMRGITFLDHLTGWAVGTLGYVGPVAVMKSSDGGVTWNIVNSNIVGLTDFRGIEFRDANHGWIAGAVSNDINPAIYVTTDGGVTWTLQLQTTHSDGAFYETCFINDSVGWAVGYAYLDSYHPGYALIYHTTDAGAHWTSQVPDLCNNLTAVTFVNENDGWAAGDPAQILHTTNGGQTWDTQSCTSFQHLCALASADAWHIWGISSAGTVVRTSDGGNSWETVSRGETMTSLVAVSFGSPNVGCAGGWGEDLLVTSDAGATWRSVYPNTGGWYTDVVMTDERHGWIGSKVAALASTSDGGNTWQRVTLPQDTAYWYSISFADHQNGWAAGDTVADGVRYPAILRTTDGGANWNYVPTVLSCGLQTIQFVNDHTGWAADVNDELVRTSDAGLTWEVQGTAATLSPQKLIFADERHGWFLTAGPNGAPTELFRTTDGGGTWELIPSSRYFSPWEVYAMTFADSLHGWISELGSGNLFGCILYSSDGGLSWAPQVTGGLTPIWDFAFTDFNTGWGVGQWGAIRHFEGHADAVTPNVAAAMPHAYSTQVWPNPFNSRTNIEFELPVSGNVRVSIYDVTGRLSASLADRRFEAGTQRISFDASALASGVYFARVEAGSTTMTRKLLLLR